MKRLLVDIEKLTYGLERGIGDTDTPYASFRPHERLRTAVCGLASAAIRACALREGIPVRLVISTPKLAFDPEIRHVLPLVYPEEGTGTVIDASSSQFLGYAGLSLAYEDIAPGIYPKEKILCFSLAQRHVAVDWLVEASVAFQKINTRPAGRFGVRLGTGALVDSTANEMLQAYSRIWDPTNLHDYTSPPHVDRHGHEASRSIPSGALAIVE